MSKLTFEEFNRANLARKKQFFKNATADDWSISDCYMAATGELGEIAETVLLVAALKHFGEAANALKKVKRAELGMLNKNEAGRQIDSLADAKAKVASEIGGFMCYLDQLADMIGLKLEDCITNEFNKKSEELGLPERIIDGGYVTSTTHKISDPMLDKLKLQKDEFDTCSKLAEAYRAITMTAPVDDDYPIIRARYEGALFNFLRAIAANGRTPPSWRKPIERSPLLPLWMMTI